MSTDIECINRIGVLTYHHTTNFGSLLQTYALYKSITDLGYVCEIIDYRNEAVEQREFLKKIYQCRGIRELKSYLQYSKYRKRKAEEFTRFLQDNLVISPEVFYKSNIVQANDRYDCFVVGSDLVWDFSINNHDTTYMLDFVEERKKKIAFSSSVGSKWKDNEKSEVKKLLGNFDAIGTREYAIQDELSRILGKHIDFVCDPTMLITPDEWKKMSSKRIISENYVLCYMANEGLTIYKDAVAYGKKHGLPVYLISYDWVPDTMKAIRPYRVEEFLSLIKYANMIFTASYHGLLFSLYFNKNFYYYNRGWKERMKSIAEYFDITGRECLQERNEMLDYCNINLKIEEFRNNSREKLKMYLAR